MSYSCSQLLSGAMSDLLLSLILLRPLLTLAENTFGSDLVLGSEINLATTPFQRLRTFISVQSSHGCLIVVGRLASVKIVEDLVSVLLLLYFLV